MLFPEDTILRYFFGVIIVKHSLDSIFMLFPGSNSLKRATTSPRGSIGRDLTSEFYFKLIVCDLQNSLLR